MILIIRPKEKKSIEAKHVYFYIITKQNKDLNNLLSKYEVCFVELKGLSPKIEHEKQVATTRVILPKYYSFCVREIPFSKVGDITQCNTHKKTIKYFKFT